MRVNLFFVFRLLVGLLLIISGFQKAILPYQNFLFTIQTYEFLPSALETVAAITIPWFELIIGVFLSLGLWLDLVVRLSLGLFVSFILIIAQALIRNIPIGECGCFGEALSVPPEVMILIDLSVIVILFLTIQNIKKAKAYSLDNRFH